MIKTYIKLKNVLLFKINKKKKKKKIQNKKKKKKEKIIN